MYQTYIIYSQSKDRYYIGSTGVGVETRVERHNEGWSRSTKSGRPWVIKYIKSFVTKSEALKWENHIKRQKSRVYIEELIHSEENEHKE
ncbi:GIY-YIG nuclease family protein [Gracilimonas sp.]|jgi:putative endonuclease|uniref:GIY-YIG nuclease family protein n=1 Tax=Gracilimonas sp. TaxID=1974203 RepID=UPI0037529234